MRTFVFLLKSKRRGELSKELLQAHVEHLRKLSKNGNLVICGPFHNDTQALQILRADSKELALSLFQADPFVAQKYYEEYEVNELIEANESNHWLMHIEQTRKNLSD